MIKKKKRFSRCKKPLKHWENICNIIDSTVFEDISKAVELLELSLTNKYIPKKHFRY